MFSLQRCQLPVTLSFRKTSSLVLAAIVAALFLTIPAGAHDPQELVVVFRIKLKPDGRLDGWPILVSSGNTPLAVAARENAARAINRGQPYDMLRAEHYELWKDIEITFDPRDMARQ